MRRAGRTSRLLLAALLLGLATIASAGTARAGMLTPDSVYQVVCLPDLGLFEIRQLAFGGFETPALAIDRLEQRVEKSYGLYAPDWHVRYKDDIMWMERVLGIDPVRFECRFGSNVAELVVLPEPLERGLAIAVTLRVVGRLIVEDVPFQACRGGTTISRLSYRHDRPSVVLEGWAVASWPFRAKPEAAFADTTATILVEPDNLRPIADHTLTWWTARPGPMTVNDIDYDYAAYWTTGAKGDFAACRYRGPGSPETRKN